MTTTESNCACARVFFKGTWPTVQTTSLSITLSCNKTEQDYTHIHTQTAEPPSLYLWQVGQSRLQSKVLSFPQPSFPAGLGKVLFHSMTVQCKMELY